MLNKSYMVTLGINRQVRYQLKDDSDGTFRIDTESGILQLVKPVDREAKPKHAITITAYDQVNKV